MKGRKVHRDNTKIYRDMVYAWTYLPDNKYPKRANKFSEKSMFKKHYCGVGFYSRYHARHVLSETFGLNKVARQVRLIQGKRLIKEGITTLPKKAVNYLYIDGRLRKVRRWIYPPEFRYDSHRRRHFIVYLVTAAEDKGVKAFNRKYKTYLYGHRKSFSWSYYKRKETKILDSFVQDIWKAKGYRPDIF